MTATDLDPAALLDALHAALDADPSDAATRQALADWCGQRRRVSSGRDHACDGCGKRWES